MADRAAELQQASDLLYKQLAGKEKALALAPQEEKVRLRQQIVMVKQKINDRWGHRLSNQSTPGARYSGQWQSGFHSLWVGTGRTTATSTKPSKNNPRRIGTV